MRIDDSRTVLVLHYGGDRFYFKLRHLLPPLDVTIASAKARTPPKHLVTFAELKTAFPFSLYSVHPATYFVSLQGLQYLTNGCCDFKKYRLQRCVSKMLLPLNKCVSDKFEVHTKNEDENITDEDDNEEENKIRCFFGVLPGNIEFCKLHKLYYKAYDVAMAAGCSPSHNINKYVSNANMVLWKDLREYAEKLCQQSIPNKWKGNTVFLKQRGLKQLLMAKQKDQLYAIINLDAERYDYDQLPPIYNKQKSRYKRKKGHITGCIVGKLNGVLDYVATATIVWFKLCQIRKYYKLRKFNLWDYQEYVTTWRVLERSFSECTVRWNASTIMINDLGVYKSLLNNDQQHIADPFYFIKLYNIKKKCANMDFLNTNNSLRDDKHD